MPVRKAVSTPNLDVAALNPCHEGLSIAPGAVPGRPADRPMRCDTPSTILELKRLKVEAGVFYY